ncbi:hypothetical protein D9613_002665 [Agrocybe pediades]|uniref:MARVEL domain-containing protein n=1 Tax=Agrocybe pediades TaxID=84607 RepID=A0A8H4VPG2_9AGAR|nr:hypothetical protein D9613_002665 [Agrocybe pediades]
MLNLLKTLRYFIFGVFVICNAIITSVAVWNLGIIESIASEVIVKRIDSYLIFVGALGLLLIFTIIFFEIHGRNVVLVRVWFELSWTGLFCLMEMAGAALITAQSTSHTCDTTITTATSWVVSPFCLLYLVFSFWLFFGSLSATVSVGESPCPSTQVLQAFTWICATLLLGYFTVLSILTFMRRTEDPTIWDCAVRRFPVLINNYRVNKSPSSTPLPRFSGQTGVPIIAAPVPRRVAVIREPVLSYQSGLSQEYEIEHFQSPASLLGHGNAPDTITRALERISTTGANQRQSQSFAQQAQQLPELSGETSILPSPFYHSSVQTALEPKDRTQQQQQNLSTQLPTTQSRPIRPLPVARTESGARRLPPSPPPLGDWPRLDATARTTDRKTSRVKRKPLPQPSQVEVELESQQYQPQPQPQPQPSSSRPQPRQEEALPSTSNAQVWDRSYSSRTQHEAVHPTTSTSIPLPSIPQPQPRAARKPPRPLPPPQPSSYRLDASELTAALQPLAAEANNPSSPRIKHRPSGPRRKSNSIDDGRGDSGGWQIARPTSNLGSLRTIWASSS